MLIRGKAPLRVSFAGGGSDVSPYSDQYGGCVLSTTIGMYVYGALEVRSDRQVNIFSLDYDELIAYELGGEINDGDKLAFLRAVIRRMNPPQGLNLYIHSDAPPGTGLGSSGAISALIVGLINHAFNFMMSRYQMAQLAYEVEHDDLGRAVGRQDHYAALFGGMNFMEFSDRGTLVVPLRVERWILEELCYHAQLFYTRKKRDSSDLVANQVKWYVEKRPETLLALAEMKQQARELQRCLLKGEMSRFGDLLHDAWLAKQRMNPDAVNPYLQELYQAGRDAGALGGKILGAGGGGFFLFYTPFMKKGRVTEALTRLGAHPVPFVLEGSGMQTWEVHEQSLAEQSEGLFPRRRLEVMDTPVFILAGGLGTRIRSVLGATPKALAPVAEGAVFVNLLADRLTGAGFSTLVFLLGHGAAAIEHHLDELRARHPGIRFEISVEETPLGTGGALRHAGHLVTGTSFLMNGDTWFEGDFAAVLAHHRRCGAVATIAAQPVEDATRFGSLELDAAGFVAAFREKGQGGPGLVDAGVYVLEPALLGHIPDGASSLERDVFPAVVRAGQRLGAAVVTGEFADIGTASDYQAFVARVAQGAPRDA